eukprot:CAMPEP_0180606816 /NCGR_PEP_ID=MMETSP1037_2-20121125/27358_1 /TAXON_ID=632150 /ORGANISM="Azadinium spinosum, Strain 3D9" /LENGTH=238 /DNA_ID=CAMNT_0022626033 /DNA_START=83 /DNA_END=799 /DNA_ORIENTATION=+
MESFPAEAPVRSMRPTKQTRRRIVCPTLGSATQERRWTLPSASPSSSPPPDGGPMSQGQAHSSAGVQDGGRQRRSRSPKGEEPCLTIPDGPCLSFSFRVLYFSRDGDQADSGDLFEIEAPSSCPVNALQRRAREIAGTGGKGKLLFKGRPLKDGHRTLAECGITSEPQALHLMLSRKHRPEEVARKAETAAAELSAAMAIVQAEVAVRPPRRKRTPPPPSSEPDTPQSVQSQSGSFSK